MGGISHQGSTSKVDDDLSIVVEKNWAALEFGPGSRSASGSVAAQKARDALKGIGMKARTGQRANLNGTRCG